MYVCVCVCDKNYDNVQCTRHEDKIYYSYIKGYCVDVDLGSVLAMSNRGWVITIIQVFQEANETAAFTSACSEG